MGLVGWIVVWLLILLRCADHDEARGDAAWCPIYLRRFVPGCCGRYKADCLHSEGASCAACLFQCASHSGKTMAFGVNRLAESIAALGH
ncbi:hypothetical protein BDW74DRAFT_152621 [Aspergillus multicolor]|uniref:uncharacterized protein n=1 Tax=Aspergillus multicolor TaxID=41759 RepID=UPI003CCCB6A2